MTNRRSAKTTELPAAAPEEIVTPAPDPQPRIGSARHTPGLAQRLGAPRSPEEAESRYVAAREVWTAAMRAASSGKAADMAALAIAQEAYEAASAERERWHHGDRVPIAIQPETTRSPIDVVVGQELAWRKVHDREGEEPKGLLGRLFGRSHRSR